MKIAFLMDHLESIDPEFETTSYLMYECNQRGHTVFFLEPHDIYVREQKVVARMEIIEVPPNLSIQEYWQRAIKCIKQEDRIFEVITEIDVLFLRKDPPLNYEIIELLAPISDKLTMINDPGSLILGNSKLYTLNFTDLIPETHISRDPKRLRKIIDTFGGDMIIKPLGRFGGEGVIKVSSRDPENLNSLINFYVKAFKPYPERDAIMVQEYLKEVKENGDVRILMLNGKILGAMRRKSPDEGFRTNIHAGGVAFKHTITKKETEICEIVGHRLVRDGLHFVGLDVIGEKLIEINCVSPGGIPRINKLNNTKLETQVIDFIEEKASENGVTLEYAKCVS